MSRSQPASSDRPGVIGDTHAELPLDPDAAIPGLVAGIRPLHRQPALLGAVFAGGLLGTLARYEFTLALPSRSGHWPTGTFAANLIGAFLLGALLEALARRGPDSGYRRVLGLGLGTGFLGAFTTYSTLATEGDLLVRGHHLGLAAGYALASVVAGLVLSIAGIQAAAVHQRRRAGEHRPPDPIAANAGTSDGELR